MSTFEKDFGHSSRNLDHHPESVFDAQGKEVIQVELQLPIFVVGIEFQNSCGHKSSISKPAPAR